MEAKSESYTLLYWLAVLVTATGAMLGTVVVLSGQLALTGQQVALIAVAQAGLTVLAGFLPRITKPPSNAREGMD